MSAIDPVFVLPAAASPAGRPPKAVPPVSAWLRDLHRELRRGRHVVLHGAVEDRVRFGNDYLDLRSALHRFLPLAGISLVVCYDPVDGLTFADEESALRFHDLRRGAASTAGAVGAEPHDAAGATGISAPQSERAQRLSQAQAQAAQMQAPSRPPRLVRPEEALPAIRSVLGLGGVRAAAVIDLLDLVLDPSLHSREERAVYAQLRLLMREAAAHPMEAQSAQHAGRNPVILVVGDLRRVPSWLYDHENPLVATVSVERPSTPERRDYFLRNANGFHGGPSAERAAMAASAEAFANLTEGMTAWELDAVQRSSHVYGVPGTEAHKLVHLHRYGPRRDPWTTLDLDPSRARAALNRRVIGQPVAIEGVLNALIAARVGLDYGGASAPSTRPRGTFMFLGATGVGKTELGKALAELIFDDEGAMARFDMSEYGSEHEAARLVGSPPGYVGHDQGGTLTNAVLENPFRVLLFDEIDKAHPRVLDRFLQVLDDGRLTDGSGRTAHFGQSLIVFTSNEGSDGLHRLLQGEGVEGHDHALPHYADVRRHYLAAVRHRLTVELGRPELFGRLGNGILVFDILRPEVMGEITAKFLGQLGASAQSDHQVTVRFDVEGISIAVAAAIRRDGSIASGGRQIRTEVDHLVRQPLAGWWCQHWPTPGTTVIVRCPQGDGPIQISAETA